MAYIWIAMWRFTCVNTIVYFINVRSAVGAVLVANRRTKVWKWMCEKTLFRGSIENKDVEKADSETLVFSLYWSGKTVTNEWHEPLQPAQNYVTLSCKVEMYGNSDGERDRATEKRSTHENSKRICWVRFSKNDHTNGHMLSAF